MREVIDTTNNRSASELTVEWEDPDTGETGVDTINYAGSDGEFYREDWINNDLRDYSEDAQGEILNALNSTTNGMFFIPDTPEEIECEIVRYLHEPSSRKNPPTTNEIAKAVQVSWHTAQKHLRILQHRGLISKIIKSKQNKWKVNINGR